MNTERDPNSWSDCTSVHMYKSCSDLMTSVRLKVITWHVEHLIWISLH